MTKWIDKKGMKKSDNRENKIKSGYRDKNNGNS